MPGPAPVESGALVLRASAQEPASKMARSEKNNAPKE